MVKCRRNLGKDGGAAMKVEERKENGTGQEIRKGDTLERNDYIKHCLNEIQAIILRNDVMFAKKVLIRVINLEKILHK